MPTASAQSAETHIIALAEFRYTLRCFLHFSEEAATAAGVAPQQHQLLLQIAGAAHASTSVGYLAERLALRHNSVVELCNRCEQAGFILRKSDPTNRRTVVLKLTAEGNRVLRRLSADHARELNEFGPRLAVALKALTKSNQRAAAQPAGATK